MTKLPLVSIIFPNYNGGKEPLECLDSIQKLNYPQSCLEVIVIDNGSTDGSDTQIKKQFLFVKLIKNTANQGFAKAINQGIKIAKGEYIFIANDDLIFEKNSLTILISYAQLHPQIGVLGGLIYSKAHPDKVTSAGYFMNLWTGNIYVNPRPQISTEPDWIQGCTLLISKKVLTDVGIFDEQFDHFFEDYDLCIRIRHFGYQIKYLPNASFWHGESTTANRDKPDKYFKWYKNKLKFMIKHLPILNILSILFFQCLLVIPYRTLILRDGRCKPFWKGLMWNLAHLLPTLASRAQLKIHRQYC